MYVKCRDFGVKICDKYTYHHAWKVKKFQSQPNWDKKSLKEMIEIKK